MKKRILVVLLSLVLTFLIPAQVLVAKTDAEKPSKDVEVSKEIGSGKSTEHRQDTVLENSLEKIQNKVKENNGFDVIHYLSLGDSIAYGMSAEEGLSYYDLYSDYLGQGSSKNLAVPGATTGDLLEALGTKEYQLAVKKADVITISIGGNNLLGPVIGYLFGAFGVDSIDELQNAISNSPDLITKLPTFIFSLQNIGVEPTLFDALESGKSSFINDIASIYVTLSELNPDAQLIFLNLYNPFPFNPTLGELNPSITDTQLILEYYLSVVNNALYLTMEGYLEKMNEMFEHTLTIDVNNNFKLSQLDPVYFNLTLDPSLFSLDIHPNTDGHELIFGELTNLIEPILTPPYKYGLITN